MEPSEKIREALASAARLRQAARDDPSLADAVHAVKRFQARRFAGTYADLLAGGRQGAAAGFFLRELYGEKDYAERDAQFARIAGTVEKVFPAQVVSVCVALAALHALTERLDHALAVQWLAQAGDPGAELPQEGLRYVRAWRVMGGRPEREAQLSSVLEIGRQMIRLSRLPGLRMMLRMMRAPAGAAGLGVLQRFLETGFDTFSAMARQRGEAEDFLQTIQQREGELIAHLFDEEIVTCGTRLERILGQAR